MRTMKMTKFQGISIDGVLGILLKENSGRNDRKLVSWDETVPLRPISLIIHEERHGKRQVQRSR